MAREKMRKEASELLQRILTVLLLFTETKPQDVIKMLPKEAPIGM